MWRKEISEDQPTPTVTRKEKELYDDSKGRINENKESPKGQKTHAFWRPQVYEEYDSPIVKRKRSQSQPLNPFNYTKTPASAWTG